MGFFSDLMDKVFDDILGFDPPKAPPLPPMPPPLPTKIKGQATSEIRRRQRSKVSGRRRTIVTGELSPEQVGKKTLLGK